MESGSGVVETRLAASPVEELETGEDVFGGAAVGKDLKDEALGEAEIEIGESKVGGVPGGCIFWGGRVLGI